MSLFLFKLAYHNAFFALCLGIHEWLFEFWTLAQNFWKTNGVVLREQNAWKSKTGFQQRSATAGRGGCWAGGCGQVGRCLLWARRSSGPCCLHLRGYFCAASLPKPWILCCVCLSFSQGGMGRNNQSRVCGEPGRPPQRHLLPLHVLGVTPRPKVRRRSVLSWGRLGKEVLRGDGLGHCNHKLRRNYQLLNTKTEAFQWKCRVRGGGMLGQVQPARDAIRKLLLGL